MDLAEYQGYRENKAHTSADFPYNTYLCAIPRYIAGVPLHWHQDAELIVVKKGRGQVSVDMTEYPVSAGDIVVVLPGRLHAISGEPGYFMEYENIIFDPVLLAPKQDDITQREFLAPFFGGGYRPETVHISPRLSWHDEAWELVETIDSYCDKRPDGYQLAVKGELFRLIFLLIRHAKKDARFASHSRSLEKMKLVVKEVEESYSRPISIEDMARRTGYSKSHFMKFFKAHMGCGFTGWLIGYRLSMAAKLLKSTDEEIREIARQSGFDNLSYFNRMFKAKYQMTPHAYRKQQPAAG